MSWDTHEDFNGAETGPPVRSGLLTASMCAAVVLIIASVASLNVALPSIGRGLGASQSDVQWIVDIFALVLAAMLLPAGALGDKFGRRKLMLIGFAVFTAAGIWATLADSVGQLLVARGLGGLGAALIFPGTLSTLTGALPPQKIGKAIGLWTASASVGGTIGTIGAGALVEHFWFGSIFLGLTLPGVAVAAMIWFCVPETSDPAHANLDPVGSILSLIGIGGLVLGITEGPVKGWSNSITLFGFALAIAGLAGFVAYELKTSRPMLDLRVFRVAAFRTGSVSVFVQFLVAIGFFFTSASYLAFVAGYGPFKVAIAYLPLAPCVPFGAAMVPKLVKRIGRGGTGATGLTAMAAGCVVFALLGAGSSYFGFALGLVLFGFGMGLAGPPATEAIIEALPRAKQGVASAVNDLSRELGGALGIALLGSALTAGYRSAIDDHASNLPADSLATVRDSAAVGYELAGQSGAEAGNIIGTIRTSLADGSSLAMWVGAGLLVLAAIYVGLRTPRHSAATEWTTETDPTAAAH